MGIPDNARCCVGVAVFQYATVDHFHGKAEIPCRMPESEYPLSDQKKEGYGNMTGNELLSFSGRLFRNLRKSAVSLFLFGSRCFPDFYLLN